jgi:hypothetical protein
VGGAELAAGGVLTLLLGAATELLGATMTAGAATTGATDALAVGRA